METNKRTVLPFMALGLISLLVFGFGSFEVLVQKSIPLAESSVLTKEEPQSPNEYDWWSPWIASTSHVYRPWNSSTYDWCFPTEQSPSIPASNIEVRGLLYIKSHKASSSTCSGVNIAIAHHIAKRKFELDKNSGDTFCEHYDRHSFHRHKAFANNRNTSQSLLWTFVRHPVARDLSELYHFHVTRRFKDPQKDAQYLLRFFRSFKAKQTKYLSLRSNDIDFDDENSDNYEQQLSTALRTHIFEKYDFIGIVERMTESLAVMTLLWNLEPTDVIVLSAKQANGDTYDDGQYENTCFKVISPPRNISELQPSLSSYIQSQRYVRNNPDFLLYHAAQESLDRTIEAIGIETVRERAALIQKLQVLAEDTCQKEAIYPCSREGVHQKDLSRDNCYNNDSGCGYACVDRLMSAYRDGKVLLK